MAYAQNIYGASRQGVVTLTQTEFGQAEPGVVCVQLRAASALLVGDAVYIDANGEAAKSATDANYLSFAGIVVGGRNTDMKVHLGSNQLGVSAADTDETVLVAITGIAYAYAGGAIVRGAQVGISANSGRVDDVATNKFAVCLDTASTNGDVVRLLLTR